VPVMAGDGSNPYQFTGEAWDAEVELLYLRARYYQPETGRFITKDPWVGNVWQPSTLNRYVYVRNDPVKSIDLGGLNGGGGPGGICPECKELMHAYEPSGVIGRGRGPLVGDPTGLRQRYNVPPPSGVAGPGKGPFFPDLDQAPYVVAADVELAPEVVELILTAWVPHEVLLGQDPDAYVLYQELMAYAETGYSRRASLSHAELMLLTWLLPIGGPDQWFGPYNSLTRDVMNDPAVAWFKTEWAKEDWYLPFERPHKIDLPGPLAWFGFAQENWELGMCVIGRGSEEAGGRIDPVGGIMGSFDLMSVEQAGVGRVRFDVLNRMDRPSFGRWPGEDDAYWLPHEWWRPRSREPLRWWPGDWWGTTVRHHFYWYEDDPRGVRR
jgi:RHS repeat-associated protein